MAIIDSFDGDYAFLSNFYPAPIVFEEKEWPTVEHAFQAQKTLDDGERELIRAAPTPGKAKRLGRKVSFPRQDWDQIKARVMLDLLRLKFTRHEPLGRQLLATSSCLLVEGNGWHDNIWGNCSCQRCGAVEGQNLLGKLLMQVRDELYQQRELGTKPLYEG